MPEYSALDHETVVLSAVAKLVVDDKLVNWASEPALPFKIIPMINVWAALELIEPVLKMLPTSVPDDNWVEPSLESPLLDPSVVEPLDDPMLGDPWVDDPLDDVDDAGAYGAK